MWCWHGDGLRPGLREWLGVVAHVVDVCVQPRALAGARGPHVDSISKETHINVYISGSGSGTTTVTSCTTIVARDLT